MNLSSGDPQPIFSNVALGQHWKILASAHHLIKPQYIHFLDALASLELVITINECRSLIFREILDQSINQTFGHPDLQPYKLQALQAYKLTSLQAYKLTSLQAYNLTTLQPKDKKTQSLDDSSGLTWDKI